MEMLVLILMDGMEHFAQGNEVMLPKLGAADAMAESQNPKVGRMEVGIAGTARPELKLGAQTKLGEKGQTNLWGYPEEGGLLNFEDE